LPTVAVIVLAPFIAAVISAEAGAVVVAAVVAIAGTTVAAAVLAVHATVAFVIGWPRWSFTVAVTVCVAPIASKDTAEVDRTIAVATGGDVESEHATANNAHVARREMRLMAFDMEDTSETHLPVRQQRMFTSFCRRYRRVRVTLNSRQSGRE
jgi:hypothetical protein